MNSTVIDFCRYLKERNIKSEDTIKSYSNDVNLFLKTITEKQMSSINREDVTNFLSYCKNKLKNSATTINRKLASLRQFFAFLELPVDLLIHHNDFMKVQHTNLNPNSLSDKQVERILQKFSESPLKGKYIKKDSKIHENCDILQGRDYTIIYLLCNTGLRISEALNIQLRDINLDKNIIIVRNGKEAKERKVFLNDKISEYLNHYINHVRPYISKLYCESSPYLFVSQQGEKLTPSGIGKKIKKICNKYKINASLHSLRHYYATSLLKNDAPLLFIKDQLGHSSLKTTEIYLNPTEDDYRKYANNLQVL